MLNALMLKKIFPTKNVRFAIVSTCKSNQIDLILAVDDTKQFHLQNIDKNANKKDYTVLAR